MNNTTPPSDYLLLGGGGASGPPSFKTSESEQLLVMSGLVIGGWVEMTTGDPEQRLLSPRVFARTGVPRNHGSKRKHCTRAGNVLTPVNII